MIALMINLEERDLLKKVCENMASPEIINDIVEHRKTCTDGPDCLLEKRIQLVTSLYQKVLDSYLEG